MKNTLTIGMVAGEASGDNLAAPLIREIQKQHPQLLFAGIGGPGMRSLGFESWYEMDRLSVNGFVDPIKRLPELLGILFSIRRRFLQNPPAVFIGVDFNFFNLLLEGMLKKRGIPTVHYVSPTVWAWRSRRIKRISKCVDLMLTLYPFETDVYRQNNIDVCFVGHPKADEYPLESASAEVRKRFGYAAQEPVLAVLPGSRSSEVRYSAPDFLRAALICLERLPGLKIIVPCVNPARRAQIAEIAQRVAPGIPIQLIDGQSDQVMSCADVVLVNSGTATLEALLLKKPMVMSYRMGALSYALVSRMTRISRFALPNILAGRELIPEFVQDQATPDRLAEAVMNQLFREDKSVLIDAYREIHLQLRRNAARSAAAAVLDMLEARHVSLT